MTDVKPPKRVAIYARYSTEMQSPKSVEDQIRDCTEEAQRNGWIVVESYADHAMSGTRGDRPEFRRLEDDLSSGRFDIVLVEHLDRLSRDQELTARFYKLALFNDIALHQLGRGEVSAMEIALTGAIAANFIDLVKQKTLRGMRGRALEGKNAGGLSYGYRSTRVVGDDGKPAGSILEIEREEAAVIRRIFSDYARGLSPRQIAAQLNAEGVPAPRGRGEGSGHWKANTIYGNRPRGTGILNNETYVGRRVWNRQSFRKDPRTDKRVARLNPPEDWKIAEVPHLRIVDEDLWQKVKARQDEVDSRREEAVAEGKRSAGASQATRRRKYLLSGLLTCGQCGGNMTVAGKGDRRRYYCANAKVKGPAVCIGMPGLLESDAGEALFSGIREGLMQEDAYRQFAQKVEAKLKAGQADAVARLKAHDRRIREVTKQNDHYLRMMGQGMTSKGIFALHQKLEAELEVLTAQRESLVPAPVQLPDDLPARYRQYVEDLTATLMDEDVSGAAADELHRLVKRAVVRWDADLGAHTLEVEGNLLEMLTKAKPTLRAGLVANEHSLNWLRG